MLGAITGILASRNKGPTISTIPFSVQSGGPILVGKIAAPNIQIQSNTILLGVNTAPTISISTARTIAQGALNVVNFSVQGPVPFDPHFANVSLLADITNSVLSDKSPVAQTMSLGTGSSISNAQQLFGNSTLFFNGTSTAFVNGSNGPGLDFGSGDYTIEAWIYTTNFAAVQGIVMKWGNSLNRQWGLAIAGGNLYTLAWDGSLSHFSSAATIPGANRWVHVAVTRESGLVRLFIDGVLDVNTLSVPGSLTPNTGPVTLGLNQDTSIWPFQGHITQARVTKGVARYTTSFTPHSGKFPQM